MKSEDKVKILGSLELKENNVIFLEIKNDLTLYEIDELLDYYNNLLKPVRVIPIDEDMKFINVINIKDKLKELISECLRYIGWNGFSKLKDQDIYNQEMLKYAKEIGLL